MVGRGGLIIIDQSNKILEKIVISLLGVPTHYPIRLADRVHTKKRYFVRTKSAFGEKKNRKDENKFFNFKERMFKGGVIYFKLIILIAYFCWAFFLDFFGKINKWIC